MKRHPIFEALVTGRFSLLLGSLALMFFALPLIPKESGLLDNIISLFGLIVLVSCLRAVVVSRKYLYFLIGLSLINVALGSTEVFSTTETPTFRTVVIVFRLIYYLLIIFSIMRRVMDKDPVTTDKICGAISAYLLLGIVWAVIYALFHHINPGSFILPEHLATDPEVAQSVFPMWTIYFSFTSLTTLGYGDIIPSIPATQTYAFMEAACGQIFLAVLVARLVALQIIHNNH